MKSFTRIHNSAIKHVQTSKIRSQKVYELMNFRGAKDILYEYFFIKCNPLKSIHIEIWCKSTSKCLYEEFHEVT